MMRRSAATAIRERQSPIRPGEKLPRFDVIAMGTSAGGLHALSTVLEPLPGDFPCGILVVQHLSPRYKSRIAELLRRKTALSVREAHDGEAIVNGGVHIAPPDWHLLAEPGNVRLLRTPALHHSRPSIDLLFQSVAASYGRRSIAVVLSGSLSDGAAGLRAVKLAGGITIAQDPAKAEFSSMPYAAIATGCVDMVLPLNRIPGALIELCTGPSVAAR